MSRRRVDCFFGPLDCAAAPALGANIRPMARGAAPAPGGATAATSFLAAASSSVTSRIWRNRSSSARSAGSSLDPLVPDALRISSSRFSLRSISAIASSMRGKSPTAGPLTHAATDSPKNRIVPASAAIPFAVAIAASPIPRSASASPSRNAGSFAIETTCPDKSLSTGRSCVPASIAAPRTAAPMRVRLSLNSSAALPASPEITSPSRSASMRISASPVAPPFNSGIRSAPDLPSSSTASAVFVAPSGSEANTSARSVITSAELRSVPSALTAATPIAPNRSTYRSVPRAASACARTRRVMPACNWPTDTSDSFAAYCSAESASVVVPIFCAVLLI